MEKNDVYKWRYSDKYKNELKIKYERDRGSYNLATSMHCKDGLALVIDDNLKLVDTYWGSSEPFILKLDKDIYELEFLCNLNEYKEIDIYEYNRSLNKYNEKDLFYMHIHAGYRNRYFIKKDATQDKQIILYSLNKELDSKKSSLSSIKRDIELLEISIKEIKEG